MEDKRSDQYWWRLLSRNDWSNNAVGKNLSPRATTGEISAVEIRVLEHDALKRTLQQALSEMPVNARGQPLAVATHFDPEHMQPIQQVLRDVMDWIGA